MNDRIWQFLYIKTKIDNFQQKQKKILKVSGFLCINSKQLNSLTGQE